ncbi:uncharacterized protein PV09_07093 [Verruconis gallopava]|uniref:Uncharacterized protein n=1 Tax=Verruconis gallopava TaxID=253628 RepID=A0A0D1YLC6_9PEZI|nr:uncharacterized protein PV09_07093 [Verruconis gallopava]KIW01622.1 hypothetical protein PV09_07093 [Verruconis gallopava]
MAATLVEGHSPARERSRTTAGMEECAERKPMSSKPFNLSAISEEIHEDDVCPICYSLLHKPVTTTCNHTMCELCLNTWADLTVIAYMNAVGLDEDTPEVLLPNLVESSCPMCRSSSTAVPNQDKEQQLKARYPRSYRRRQAESEEFEANESSDSVKPLTIYVGNTHRLVRVGSDNEETRNRHEWNFFVRPSRHDLIKEVHVHLHPTFRNPRLILQSPPFQARRLGWGCFTIYASVILKAGYCWLRNDAEDTTNGASKASLPIEWLLDFNNGGSQKRCRLKVQGEGERKEDKKKTRVATDKMISPPRTSSS